VLVTPTAGTIYRIPEIEADPVRLNTHLGFYTNFMNLLDLAGVAVPAGFTAPVCHLASPWWDLPGATTSCSYWPPDSSTTPQRVSARRDCRCRWSPTSTGTH